MMIKTKENNFFFSPSNIHSWASQSLQRNEDYEGSFLIYRSLWPSRRNIPDSVPVPQRLIYSGRHIGGTKRNVL